MAAPTDRVQVMKQESAAGGGNPADADPFYASERINEHEDGISAAGVFLQEQGGPPADEDVCIWRESGVLKAKDAVSGTVDLLANGSTDQYVKVSATDTTTAYLADKIQEGSGIVTKVLSPSGDEKLEINLGFRRQFLFMGA